MPPALAGSAILAWLRCTTPWAVGPAAVTTALPVQGCFEEPSPVRYRPWRPGCSGTERVIEHQRMRRYCYLLSSHCTASQPRGFPLQVCQSTEAEGAVGPLKNQCHPNNTLVRQWPLFSAAPPAQPATGSETAGGRASQSSVPVGAIVGGAGGGAGEHEMPGDRTRLTATAAVLPAAAVRAGGLLGIILPAERRPC